MASSTSGNGNLVDEFEEAFQVGIHMCGCVRIELAE